MNALKSHYWRTFSTRTFALALAALATCIALTSCAPGGPLPPEDRAPFEASAPVIDNASLYGEGESIPMPANVPDRTGQFTNEEVNLFYPQLQRTSQLPEGMAAADFAPTVLDEASRASLQERFGFAPDADGNPPAGCSYVLVTAQVQNTVDAEAIFDTAQGSFALLNEDGTYASVGTDDPLWQSARDSASPKQYFHIRLAPHEKREVSTLYLVPDEALDNPRLVFIANPGLSDGEGIAGVKAFAIASQLQK